MLRKEWIPDRQIAGTALVILSSESINKSYQSLLENAYIQLLLFISIAKSLARDTNISPRQQQQPPQRSSSSTTALSVAFTQEII